MCYHPCADATEAEESERRMSHCPLSLLSGYVHKKLVTQSNTELHLVLDTAEGACRGRGIKPCFIAITAVQAQQDSIHSHKAAKYETTMIICILIVIIADHMSCCYCHH